MQTMSDENLRARLRDLRKELDLSRRQENVVNTNPPQEQVNKPPQLQEPPSIPAVATSSPSVAESISSPTVAKSPGPIGESGSKVGKETVDAFLLRALQTIVRDHGGGRMKPSELEATFQAVTRIPWDYFKSHTVAEFIAEYPSIFAMVNGEISLIGSPKTERPSPKVRTSEKANPISKAASPQNDIAKKLSVLNNSLRKEEVLLEEHRNALASHCGVIMSEEEALRQLRGQIGPMVAFMNNNDIQELQILPIPAGVPISLHTKGPKDPRFPRLLSQIRAVVDEDLEVARHREAQIIEALSNSEARKQSMSARLEEQAVIVNNLRFKVAELESQRGSVNTSPFVRRVLAAVEQVQKNHVATSESELDTIERLIIACVTLDTLGVNRLMEDDILRAVVLSHVEISRTAALSLLKKCTASNNGSYFYPDFVALVVDYLAAQASMRRSKSPRKVPKAVTEMSEAEMRTFFLELFRTADVDHNGVLDCFEMAELLKSTQLNFSTAMIRRVIEEADSDHNGVVDYTEFIPLMIQIVKAWLVKEHVKQTSEAETEAARQAAINYLLNGISRAQLEAAITESFHAADRNGDGRLSKTEFREAIKGAGFGLSKKEINALLVSVDTDHDGFVSISEWIPICFDVLVELLTEKLLERPGDLGELEGFFFKLFSDKCSGDDKSMISQRHARECLEDCGLAAVQVQSIVSEATFDGSGLIKIRPFSRIVAQMTFDFFRDNAIPGKSAPASEIAKSEAATRRVVVLPSLPGPLHTLSKPQKETYFKALFQAADHDGNGVLDQSEMAHLLRHCGLGFSNDMIRRVIEAADTNGDGVCSYSEFVPMMADLITSLFSKQSVHRTSEEEKKSATDMALELLLHRMPRSKLEATLFSIFNAADTDGSGLLDRKEFVRCISDADLGFSKRECNALFSVADTDGDKLVSLDEFLPLAFDILVAVIRDKIIEQSHFGEHMTQLQQYFLEHLSPFANAEGLVSQRVALRVLQDMGLSPIQAQACVSEATVNASGLLRVVPFSRVVAAITHTYYERPFTNKAAVTPKPTVASSPARVVASSPVKVVTISNPTPSPSKQPHAAAVQKSILELDRNELNERLHTLFKQADVERSGKLNVKAVGRLLKMADLKLPTKVVRQVLRRADVNKDGFISYEEFLPLVADIIFSCRVMSEADTAQQQREVEARAQAINHLLGGVSRNRLEAGLRDIFNRADVDGNGVLDHSEFKKCLQEARLGLSRREIDLIMVGIDDNEDGVISYAEFTKAAFSIIVEIITESILKSQDKSDLERALLSILAEQDTTNSGRLTLHQIRDVLVKRVNLTPLHAEAILNDLPVDGQGMIHYKRYSRVISDMTRELMMGEALAMEFNADTTIAPPPAQVKNVSQSSMSAEDLAQMFMDIFRDADTNGDGALDYTEVATLLRATDFGFTNAQIHKVMDSCDINHDGKIDINEFVPLLTELIQSFMVTSSVITATAEERARARAAALDFLLGHLSRVELEASIADTFTAADTDGSGELDPTEFVACLRQAELGLTKKECLRVFMEADTSKDGKLSISEFIPVAFEVLLEILTERMLDSTSSLTELQEFFVSLFSKADVTGSGKISQHDARSCLDSVGLSPIQLQTIMHEAVIDGDGMIRYRPFARIVSHMTFSYYRNTPRKTSKGSSSASKPSAAPSPAPVPKSSPNPPPPVNRVEEPVRNIHQLSTQELHNLITELFMAADRDGNGVLDIGELGAALRSTNLGFSKAMIRHVLESADKNGDGVVSYREFIPLAVELIQSFILKERAHNTTEQERNVARAQATEYLLRGVSRQRLESSIREIFEAADTDHNGTLDRKEFVSCLRRADLGLSRAEINAMYSEVDTNGDGVIQIEEFSSICFELLLELITEKILDQSGDLKELHQFFEQLFANHGSDGFITQHAANAALESVGLSSIQGQTILSEAVVDKSGLIRYRPFSRIAARLTFDYFVENSLPKSKVTRAVPQSSSPVKASPKVTPVRTNQSLSDIPPAELEYLFRSLWRVADTDQNGVLDLSEVKVLLKSSGLNFSNVMIRECLESCDTNGDGVVQYDEFISMMKQLVLAWSVKKKNADHEAATSVDARKRAEEFLIQDMTREQFEKLISDLFHASDLDGDGRLDRNEFREVLKRAQIGVSRREANALFEIVDADNSGYIDIVEFLPFCFELLVALIADKLVSRSSNLVELEDFFIDLFRKCDRTNTGFIKQTAAREQLSSIGLEVIQVQTIMSEATPDPSGLLRYAPFARVAAAMSFEFFKAGAISPKSKKSVGETKQSVASPSTQPSTQPSKQASTQASTQRRASYLDMSVAELERELVAIFQAADVDHNGILDANEAYRLVKLADLGFSNAMIWHVLEDADSNGDGVIDVREFVTLMLSIADTWRVKVHSRAVTEAQENQARQQAMDYLLRGVSKERLEHSIREIFLAADVDGSGQLDRKEFRDCMMRADLGITKKESSSLFALLDTNHNGLLSIDEFIPVCINLLVELIKEKILARSEHHSELEKYFLDLFEKSDEHGVGKLSPRQIRAALESIGLSVMQCEAIISEATADASGLIRYGPFSRIAAQMTFDFFKKSDARKAKVSAAPKVATPKKTVDQMTRFELERHFLELFQAADRDGNGILDAHEFSTLLKNTGLGFTSAMIRHVIEEADTNHDGKIDYSEFLNVMVQIVQAWIAADRSRIVTTADEEQARLKAINYLFNGISRQQLETTIAQVFRRADKDHNGLLNRQEFLACMKEANVGLSKKEINALMVEVDTDGDGFVSISEFVPLCVDVLVGILKDKFLDFRASSFIELETFFVELFVQFDNDGSGRIAKHDIQSSLHTVGLSAVQIQTILSDAAVDATGLVRIDRLSRQAAQITYSFFAGSGGSC